VRCRPCGITPNSTGSILARPGKQRKDRAHCSERARQTRIAGAPRTLWFSRRQRDTGMSSYLAILSPFLLAGTSFVAQCYQRIHSSRAMGWEPTGQKSSN